MLGLQARATKPTLVYTLQERVIYKDTRIFHDTVLGPEATLMSLYSSKYVTVEIWFIRFHTFLARDSKISSENILKSVYFPKDLR